MKKSILLIGLAALIASCSDDDRNNDTDNQHLVSPSMAVSISNTNGRQSPFTGILTIMPCDANSSIYYGNYVKGKLSPFYGYYRVKDGSFHDNSINRELFSYLQVSRISCRQQIFITGGTLKELALQVVDGVLASIICKWLDRK